MLERLLRRQTDRSSATSSSDESETSATKSEGEENPTYRGVQEERRPRGHTGDDPRRGQPKLTCLTFNRDDPISWLSRAQQYFDLNEILKEDKVRYATYYMEGEANVW
ncbi:hypothetical protein ACS0TY_031529 [Phlomoides rotata]